MAHNYLLLMISLIFYSTYAQSDLILGITFDTDRIVVFNSTNPTDPFIGAEISQIPTNLTIRSIDFRPATGQLYAIATTDPAGGLQFAQLYTINIGDGTATAVGVPFVLVSGTTGVHIDFNPVVDLIRLVTEDNLNLRINPDTGIIVGIDGNLTFADGDVNEGDNPQVVNIAYNNNFAGASTTTLYAIDFTNFVLTTIGNVNGTPVTPNTGTLFTVALINISSVATPLGFDISGNTGIAYVSDAFGNIYTLDLISGDLLLINGTGQLLLDITAFPAPVNPSSTTASITTASLTTATPSNGATTSSVTTGVVPGTPCTIDRSQVCLDNDTFTTCTNGRYSSPQGCLVGLVCDPAGNFIYCVRPEEVVDPGLAGVPCSPDGSQVCLSANNTYTTCTNGFYSRTQTCQPGLTCSPLGSNIYCI